MNPIRKMFGPRMSGGMFDQLGRYEQWWIATRGRLPNVHYANLSCSMKEFYQAMDKPPMREIRQEETMNLEYGRETVSGNVVTKAAWDLGPVLVIVDSLFDNARESLSLQIMHDASRGSDRFMTWLSDNFERLRAERTAPFRFMFKCGGEIQTRLMHLEAPDIVPSAYPGFEDADAAIRRAIETNGGGAVVLGGLRGSGKTTYIQHLAALYGNRRSFVYIPSDLSDHLDSPDVIGPLFDLTFPVAVVEDAENVISRTPDNRRAKGTPAILNLADGFIGKAMRVLLILTHNEPVKDVDPALMRSGRLVAQHEFGTLGREQAEDLARSIGARDFVWEKGMTVSDVYRKAPPKSDNGRRRVGFSNDDEAPRSAA